MADISKDPFQLLDDVLRDSGLASDPAWQHVLPFVRWSASADDATRELKAFLVQRRPDALNEPLLLLVDGVPKKYRGTTELVDDVVLASCKNAGFAKAELVNASDAVGVKPEDLHASVQNLPALRKLLREKAVGGSVCVLCTGTLSDLTKHAMHLEGMTGTPLVVFPTAITVTAFTSTFAVIDDAGKKASLVSRCPDANFFVYPIIEKAPVALSRAGYGDMLARLIAYGDWYLAWELGMVERYDEQAFRVTAPFMDLLKSISSGFAGEKLDEGTAKASAACLVMAGIAMSTSGETTPLSGYEHEISHALDFLRYTARDPLVLHGEQVALACLTSAAGYDWLLSLPNLDETEVRVPGPEEVARDCAVLVESAPFVVEPGAPHALPPAARAAAERAGRGFAAELVYKNERFQAVVEGRGPRGTSWASFQARWPEIRAHLRTLVTPYSEVRKLVAGAGIATAPEGLDVSPHVTRQQYEWAVSFAPYVRKRFALSDVLYWCGMSGNTVPNAV
eukprot:tig00022075_g23637.t1